MVMRQLLMVFVMVAMIATAARADEKAEIKGPHICCPACARSIDEILGKVEGVSDVKASIANKSVTFTAKNKAAAEKALDALFAGGFAGTCKVGDATLTRAAVKVEGKGDSVVVKDVHACCGQCHTAIKGLFPDAKVTIAGSGAQREVTVAGKDLDFAVVLKALTDKGVNGKIETK